MKLRAAVPLPLIACSLVLAACGGGNGASDAAGLEEAQTLLADARTNALNICPDSATSGEPLDGAPSTYGELGDALVGLIENEKTLDDPDVTRDITATIENMRSCPAADAQAQADRAQNLRAQKLGGSGESE